MSASTRMPLAFRVQVSPTGDSADAETRTGICAAARSLMDTAREYGAGDPRARFIHVRADGTLALVREDVKRSELTTAEGAPMKR